MLHIDYFALFHISCWNFIMYCFVSVINRASSQEENAPEKKDIFDINKGKTCLVSDRILKYSYLLNFKILESMANQEIQK